ncbi:class I SAM-dependent methyltransferase [Candidatus Micrarchaeota archaeon]|nr:class I SAM-dependent methyltransferase [Candidatus Micrarchaeota archaeon]
MNRAYWESIYEKPLSDIPWEIEKPPPELMFVLEKGWIKKDGRVLDVACGTGNYSFFLAKHGFEVEGIDLSQNAISISKSRISQFSSSNPSCLPPIFSSMDVFDIPSRFEGKFDLIFDYSLLHHIQHEQTSKYLSVMTNQLNQKGKYVLVCYSDLDSEGQSSVVGKFGNDIYYRSADEIRASVIGLKELHYSKTTLGKRNHHKAHFFVFEK